MEFKVGQRVRIKTVTELKKDLPGYKWGYAFSTPYEVFYNVKMHALENNIYIINRISSSRIYLKEIGWTWHKNWVAPVSNKKYNTHKIIKLT